MSPIGHIITQGAQNGSHTPSGPRPGHGACILMTHAGIVVSVEVHREGRRGESARHSVDCLQKSNFRMSGPTPHGADPGRAWDVSALVAWDRPAAVVMRRRWQALPRCLGIFYQSLLLCWARGGLGKCCKEGIVPLWTETV